MHVVIFAGGTLRPGKAVESAIASADLIVAADSGASTALSYNCVPAFVVGDLDSLGIPVQALENMGSQFVRALVEKNETDTELAIDIAIEQGAHTITLLGAVGGARIEHTMANVLLLVSYEKIPIRIVDGPSICWLVRGPGSTDIYGHSNDLLSLFPMAGDATGVQTTGLYYPLRKETLRFGKPRGISNALLQEHGSVALDGGILLVIHTSIEELQE
jgi:thiamine pyrophosphokinase